MPQSEKMLIEKIFDPNMGWNYSEKQVPVRQTLASDGNPNFIVKVDDIEMRVFEWTRWQTSVSSKQAPMRIVVRTTFTNVNLLDAKKLLDGSFDAAGLPGFALDKDGQIVLQAAFPVGPDFPVDLARKQLLVCMGLISEDATELLQAWNQNKTTSDDSKKTSEFDWDTAQGVAKVAGTFARALFFG